MTAPYSPGRVRSSRTALPGLSADETSEFEQLDASLPFAGLHVWPTEGLPLMPAEVRWHELWSRHRKAVENAASSSAGRSDNCSLGRV